MTLRSAMKTPLRRTTRGPAVPATPVTQVQLVLLSAIVFDFGYFIVCVLLIIHQVDITIISMQEAHKALCLKVMAIHGSNQTKVNAVPR